MLVIGASDGHAAFFSEDTGIDWNVIFLLLGMMVIVSVVKQTGVFEYLAIWAAKRARGRPYRVLVLLCTITAVASAAAGQRDHRAAGRAGHAAGLRPDRGAPRGLT